MKKWRDTWPFLGAVVLAILNVDWVLAPLIRSFVDSMLLLFVILVILANAELLGWFHFWRWFFTSFIPRRHEIRETVEFAKEIGTELKQKGYIDRVVDHFESTFRWATNPNQWLFRVIKTGGHFGMVFLGFEPFVAGGRLVGVLFCATTGWKAGIYPLCVGNAIHILVVIGSWEIIFYIGHSLKQMLFS